MTENNQTPPPPPEEGSQGQQPPAQGQPAQPGAALTEKDSRLYAMLGHLGIAVSALVGVTIFAPLVIWLIFRERSAYVDEQGKEAVNFSIMLFIAYVVGWILAFVLIGFVILFAAWLLSIIFGIMAAIAANKGEHYRYPMTIRFIK
ncbi:DUF4870 domain-containing protein [Demequina flava]|uniref:DUF4870 domain-containing protein n=1 Tax=Demequina flava TaxID=1095025 RepID=UPI000781FB7B|nr:DUF4870 domain-containing protein [Demequina flava]